ncbi:hypothetical protein HMPREF0281_01192 [Corynebacterium ammoniagenes DSM 20306]|uniref:Uncharacterized protein n=1 Tax=Corynebacterium ammoniagenes DSM 20306 TaxID=649754 RepID=A0ABN0AF24_CORAM|nr:hypothetical protein HMPREF0281_01192 [Corynebacterium ammoniagenes DSM 20306]
MDDNNRGVYRRRLLGICSALVAKTVAYPIEIYGTVLKANSGAPFVLQECRHFSNKALIRWGRKIMMSWQKGVRMPNIRQVNL